MRFWDSSALMPLLVPEARSDQLVGPFWVGYAGCERWNLTPLDDR